MRIGVLGLGTIGRMHARHAAGNDEVRELVLCSRDAAKAQRMATELGARGMSDVDGMLAEVDGVLIASSTPSHPELIRCAVRQGVPVLCEKPAATERDELVALHEDVRASGVPVLIAFHRRYDAGYRELHRRVSDGELGQLQLLRSVGHDREPPPPAYIPESGGIWRDLLVHDFDALHWMAGARAVRVSAQGTPFGGAMYSEHGDVDAAVVQLEFANGVLAQATGLRSNGQGYDCRLEAFGTHGAVCAGLGPNPPLRSTEPDVPAPAETHRGYPDRFGPAYRAELAHFLDVIRGAAANRTPISDGLHPLEIALAAERSFAHGRTVHVDENGVLA